MNVQFAIQHAFSDHPEIFVLEVNPRASRTVPFVSKSTGQQLAKIAARCMVGQSLEEQKQPVEVELDHYSVKEAVFPFAKFLGVDPVLGPEMRSTGEVMGVGRSFGEALFKSQLGADSAIPKSGRVFISVKTSLVCRSSLRTSRKQAISSLLLAARPKSSAKPATDAMW